MLEIVRCAELPRFSFETVDRANMDWMPAFWHAFYVHKGGLKSHTGDRRGVRQPFHLASHDLGWRSTSPGWERNVASFIAALKKCGATPSSDKTKRGVALVDFCFDVSSKTMHAYYLLTSGVIVTRSCSIAALRTTVYRPTMRNFDPAVMRNLKFLDEALSIIARGCEVQRLRDRP